MTPSPVPRHQLAVLRIAAALLAHTDAHGGIALPAPVDVRFSDDTVFEPDVVALTADRLDDGGHGAPQVVLADGRVASTALAGFTMPASAALAIEDR